MAEETAGSIQNPAAAQSLVSILPTFGLVPNTGVMPIGGSTRDIVGPHAKSVYDAAITLDAIAGHSSEDPKTTVAIGKIPEGGYTSQLTATALEGKRIGLFGPGWRSVGLSGETQSLYDQAKATLASEGATLVEDPFVGTRFDSLGPNSVNEELRGMETIIYDFEQYLDRMFEGAEPKAIEHLESLSGVDLFGDGGPLNIFVQFSPNRGVTNASLENPDAEPNLSQFLAIRARYQQIFGEVMAANELDALVFPHASRAPPQLLGNQEFTPIAVPEINMLGTPGITVPAGYYENGSPFSLMFLGEQFDEAELLGYAFDFEQATQVRIPPELSVLGDFNGNGMFDVTDIDALSMEVRRSTSNIFFDLNGDGRDDAADIKIWVTELANTYIGDANLDGEFNSADLIKVFQQNEYEDDVRRNSVWSDGDWNGDGDFTSSDFIAAFQDGGYEKGPRSNAEIVPEPSLHLVAIGAIAFAIRRRIRR